MKGQNYYVVIFSTTVTFD